MSSKWAVFKYEDRNSHEFKIFVLRRIFKSDKIQALSLMKGWLEVDFWKTSFNELFGVKLTVDDENYLFYQEKQEECMT